MAGAREVRRLGVQVPQAQRCVARAAGQMLAVGAEAERDHGLRVAGHGAGAASDGAHLEDGLRLVDDVDDGFRVGGGQIEGFVQRLLQFGLADEEQERRGIGLERGGMKESAY